MRIFQALETGVIDATEWVGPYDDQILGFNRVASFYYAPDWHEPGPLLGTYMNLDVYNSLPEDIQNAVQTASAAANVQMLADYRARNGGALAEIMAGGNVELRTFPTEYLNTLEGFANEIFAEAADSNAMFAKIWEPWTAFRDDIRGFHAISEKAYLDYAIG